MENYRIYNNAHLALLGGLVIILGLNVFDLDSGLWFLSFLVLIPLGFIQLITGIHFITSMKNRSQEIRYGFRLYWTLTLAYWLLFILLTSVFSLPIEFNFVYLFVLAYPIASYQYFLVQRSLRERKDSKIKPAEL